MLRHAFSLFASGWARESSFYFCIITSLLSTRLHTCFNQKNVGSAYTFSIQPGQEGKFGSHMTVPQESRFLSTQILVY